MKAPEVQFTRDITEMECHARWSTFQGSNGSAQGPRSAKAETLTHLSMDSYECRTLLLWSSFIHPSPGGWERGTADLRIPQPVVGAWGAQETLGFTYTVRSLKRSKLWRVLISDTERDAELWCNFQIGGFNLGYTLTLESPAALKINVVIQISNFNLPIVYYYLSKTQFFFSVFTSGGD